MGHVIFVDRLLYPYFDHPLLGGVTINDRDLGKIEPFFQRDSGVENRAQAITMYLLTVLTRNLFPEVIGYPDPLHKADWGAKTLERRARNIIRDSEAAFRCKPVNIPLRSSREDGGK